jgi:hypothetical protein
MSSQSVLFWDRKQRIFSTFVSPTTHELHHASLLANISSFPLLLPSCHSSARQMTFQWLSFQRPRAVCYWYSRLFSGNLKSFIFRIFCFPHVSIKRQYERILVLLHTFLIIRLSTFSWKYSGICMVIAHSLVLLWVISLPSLPILFPFR